MSIALIPGSFDPITLGHMDIITRTAACFEQVIVAVMTNDMRKYVPDAPIKRYCFTLSERRELAELACASLPNVKVLSAEGMLVELFARVGADVLVKGVRNEQDFAYEQKHAHYNRGLDPRVETLYMPADPSLEGVSSTLVRERMLRGESLEGLLPSSVLAWITLRSERKADRG